MWRKLITNIPVGLMLATTAINVYQYFNMHFVPSILLVDLQAQIKTNRAIDSIANVLVMQRGSNLESDIKYIKDLSESNTLMLCSLSPDKVTLKLPCARLQREWGMK